MPGSRDDDGFEPVWPAEAGGRPPIDGIVAALESFVEISDAGPLEIEETISHFFGVLGAGMPVEPGEPGHEELVNGIVEVCLHHLGDGLPRVALDFLWVLDAFDPGFLTWPLRDRLEESRFPSRPAWAFAVGRAEVTGCHIAEHETGDGFDVVLLARHPGADADHVVAVYIDRTLGGLATDVLVHRDADEYLRLTDEAPGMELRDLDGAVAGATIDEALEATLSAEVSDSIPVGLTSRFGLVDHYVAKLPPSGSPLPKTTPWTGEQIVVLVRSFVDGPGAAFADWTDVLVGALEFVNESLGGDPERWTGPVTDIVSHAWLPIAGFSQAERDRFPDLVRAFVPWVHQRKGWGDRYVENVLSVLDRAEEGRPVTDVSGGVDIIQRAVAEGVDLDDEAALDAFLDRYLDEQDD